MKVLFVLGSYYPVASPNGICAENIMKNMVAEGSQVDCLCVGSEINDCKLKNGVRVYQVNRDRLHYAEEVVNAKQRRRLGKSFLNFCMRVKHVVLAPCWPLLEPIRKNAMCRKAEYLYKENQYDVVVCIHKPIDSLYVGKGLKKNHPKIKNVSYFLDSLSGGILQSPFTYEKALKKALTAERRLLETSDRIVFMNSSEAHQRRHNNSQPFWNKVVFLDIPLLESNLEVREKKQNERTVIVFAGSLNYPVRNVKYILDVVLTMDRDDVEVLLIGSTNIEDVINEFSLKSDGRIRYLPFMPHDEVKEYISNASILLNMGVKTESAISGKIFEYMSYGKPIISTYSIDNEACLPYLREYPLALTLDERENSIQLQAEKLSRFIDRTKGKQIEMDDISSKLYANTPEAFISTIKEIV